MDATTGADGFTGDQGRRDALKKIRVGAAGAAAVWSVPNVLSANAAAAATPPPVGGCQGCELENVLNGSFENPPYVLGINAIPTDWTIVGSGAGRAYVNLPARPPGDQGDQACVLFEPGVTLSQTFAVDPSCWGRSYFFQFWAYSLGAAGSATLAFVGSGAPNVVVPIIGNPFSQPLVFLHYSDIGTIPIGTTAVTLTFRAGTQGVFDSVSCVIGC